ncbi:MAG: DNA-packaging protein [Pseudomonadota bacterium]
MSEGETGRELLARLARLPERERSRLLQGLEHRHVRRLLEEWELWAHDGQRAPEGDWTIWLIRAGRGFGKTRAGAEWLSEQARRHPGARIALVGGTAEDARRVMIEGESGLIAVARTGEPVRWRTDKGEIHFASGARGFVYSAAAPEALRGPEHHFAWCDELAKWGPGGERAWDNLMLGLRLGARPRVVVTTTPRAVPLMRRVMRAPGLVETRGRTGDNPWLSTRFVELMQGQHGGTRLGRQELDGEMVEDAEGALWTRAMIEACRGGVPVEVRRVVVGVDPPAGTEGDACGIVAVALGDDALGHVIEDASVARASPERWARAVAECAARHGADRVIAEANQGGAMVASVLHAASAALPVRLVHASRGKSARAEPVAALYEAGRVRHAGAFPALEDQLCGMTAGGGYVGPGRSPDRADALVWALTALMLAGRGEASVRGL